MLNKILDRIKEEKAVAAILIITAISCLFVHVQDFTEYIDTYTVGLWFSILAISAGLTENSVFDFISSKLLSKISNTRQAAFILVFLTFFTAPFTTNLTAMAFFMPIAVKMLSFDRSVMLHIVSLQTAAASLGAMIFPSASLHNLYMYRRYHLTYGRYVDIILPLYAAGAAVLFVLCLLTKKTAVEPKNIPELKKPDNPYYVIIYATLLLLEIFAVLGILNMLTVFASVCLAVVIMEPKIFSDIDYTGLILLTAMFILLGNLSRIRELTLLLSRVFSGKVYDFTVLVSQLTSNLPSAMFFSMFGHSPPDMIISANIGGLGLISASAAGMYGNRIWRETQNSEAGKFAFHSSVTGIMITVILYAAYKLLFPLLP